MDDKVNVLEIPTLGRSVCIGTLYDCRSHQVISPGRPLWDPETIASHTETKEQKGQTFTLLASDCPNEKNQALEIDESLNAGILAGLVKPKGSAKYLIDPIPPESTHRCALHVRATCTLQQFSQADTATSKIQIPDVFTQGKATHVVVGILYGTDAFFVFDKKIHGVECSKSVRNLVAKLKPHNTEGEDGENDFDQSEAIDVQCKVFCDLALDRSPSDYKGAAKLIARLPEILEDDAVPIKAFMYPLYKLDSRAARVCKVISTELLSQAQCFVQGLEQCLAKGRDMAADPICSEFIQLSEKFETFMRILNEYKSQFKKEMARMIPLIHGGSEGESILKELLQNAGLSPFNVDELKGWLTSKQKEFTAISLYVKFLPKVEIVKTRETLDAFLMDPAIDNVVCFTFRLIGQKEAYLTTLSQYPNTRKESSYSERQWFDDVAIMKFMRGKAKLFSWFCEANVESRCTKFIVTGFGDVTSPSQETKVGGTILLYEQGVLTQQDYEPPSQPGKPRCQVLDHSTLEVNWTQPEFGADSIQSYIVKTRRFRGHGISKDKEARTQQTEAHFTIDDLQPNEQLEVHVAAVCPIGVSLDSESSGIVTTLPASPPGQPEAHPVSATSIALEWDQPTQSGKHVIISTYEIEFGPFANGKLQSTKHVETGSAERRFTVCELEANTQYVFRVIAIYQSGVASLSSISSEVCKTFPTTQPGKPEVIDVKADNVTLQWSHPDTIGQGVRMLEYSIQYIVQDEQHTETWSKVLTNKMDNQFTLSELMPNATYVVRVILVFEDDFEIPSEVSVPFTTLPAGPPTDINVCQISVSDVELQWVKPKPTDQHKGIKCYSIRYQSREDGSCDATVRETKDPSCTFIIKDVTPETRLEITVTAVCGAHDTLGECSDVSVFTTRRPLKLDIVDHASIVTPADKKREKPCILKLPLDPVGINSTQGESYGYGLPPDQPAVQHKVVMLVGVTGSGKSTLINGMINHIFDVERQDDFRFKIVDVGEAKGASQAHSQTQILTSYTIYQNRYLRLPYTLTVIDTPGFGDTRGIDRDKAIFDQIREFFLDAESHGVDHIDAIGFVVQASQSRLTHTQQYVFDSILSLFGKDISENIVLLVTFGDSSSPPVLDAVKEANIPYTEMFKFNNSALFCGIGSNRKGRKKKSKENSGGDHSFDDMFWQMGKESFQTFLLSVQGLEARSLFLTKAVLEERKRLEITVQGLQPQIQAGICKLEELRMEHQILEQHEAEIEANTDFELEVEVPRFKRIDITGHFITNCSKCHFTCHYPCGIGDDTKKADCSAMRNGVCTACPGKCPWDVHFNQQYRFDYYTEKELRTYKEIEARYKDATGKKMTVEQVIKKQLEEFDAVRCCVFQLIGDSHQSITRLEEIALKPNPLSTVEYVDVMIESEKRSHKPGWQNRVTALQDVRKEADIMGKVKQGNYDPFDHYKKTFSKSKGGKVLNWFASFFKQ